MEGENTMALLLGLIGAGIGIAALIVAVLSMLSNVYSQKVAENAMYTSINTFVTKHYNELGPLTPYDLTSDNDELLIRQLFLLRLNRFKFSTGNKHQHVLFRKKVMGDSLEDFYAHVISKFGERLEEGQEYARKAITALKEIRHREPYFDDAFWSMYFCEWTDWNWSPHESNDAGH